MLHEKFKMSLNVDELNVLQHLLEMAVRLPLASEDFQRKMLLCAMKEIHEKVLVKWYYPTTVIKITLTNTQAVAFYLMFNDEYFSNSFTDLTVKTICNKIHKQYI